MNTDSLASLCISGFISVVFALTFRRQQPSRFPSPYTHLCRLKLSWGFGVVYLYLSPRRCLTRSPHLGTVLVTLFDFCLLSVRLTMASWPSFQVPGLHASQPVTAKPPGPVRWRPHQGSLLSFPWHAAFRHGQATVGLTLPAYEWQPAASLRQPDQPGAWHGFLPANGFSAHAGEQTFNHSII